MHAPYQRTLRANAKLNLLLRILERGAGGYHGIETVFQRLALHDLVHVSVNDGTRSVNCDGPSLPPEGLGDETKNIAWRAAEQYATAAGWDTGWHIEIEKRIPVGGGLGGGSADAAAVLRALEAMCPSPLGNGALMELASTIGADVPFLLSDASLALAWGRGDRLLSFPALPEMGVTMVTFDDGVSTGEAYAAVSWTREDGARSPGGMHYPASAFADWQALSALAVNDFEDVVPAMHDGVREVLPLVQDEAARLRAAGFPAIGQLSGSGATCFIVHPLDVSVQLSPAVGSVRCTKTS
jgi:4-diphosphocytidyl-2-C-methyl-D-erythritol kinase